MFATGRFLVATLVLAVAAAGFGMLWNQGSAEADAQRAPATLRIGYVDLQRVLTEVEDAARARTRLERELAQRQERLDRDQQAFMEYAQELEASLPMLNEDARMQRMQEYQQRMMELQQRFASLQRELAELESGATAEILDRMVDIAAGIARENNLTMMIEKNSAGIVYAVDGLDFTDELVRRANAAR